MDWEGGTGLVVAFLELLTRRMKEALPGADPAHSTSPALVLWYDSVTHDTGELKWQDGACGVPSESGLLHWTGRRVHRQATDAWIHPSPIHPIHPHTHQTLAALNERNEAFFRASDGIFTNYCWKEDEPARSAARAAAAAGTDGARSRRWDVFMGIDCFGRNTYGGGGFDCDVALRAIRQAGVSAALFAPGWVWEDQVERARRRALGEEEVEEEEEQKGDGEGEETEGVQQKEGEGGETASAVAISAVEKEEWDWRRVEAEFEATQERFWAKIGAMWCVRWGCFWLFPLFPDFITHV